MYPVCDLVAGEYSITAGIHQVIKCSNRGSEYTTSNPSAKELLNFYSDYSDIRENSEIVSMNAERMNDLTGTIKLRSWKKIKA